MTARKNIQAPIHIGANDTLIIKFNILKWNFNF